MMDRSARDPLGAYHKGVRQGTGERLGPGEANWPGPLRVPPA